MFRDIFGSSHTRWYFFFGKAHKISMVSNYIPKIYRLAKFENFLHIDIEIWSSKSHQFHLYHTPNLVNNILTGYTLCTNSIWMLNIYTNANVNPTEYYEFGVWLMKNKFWWNIHSRFIFTLSTTRQMGMYSTVELTTGQNNRIKTQRWKTQKIWIANKIKRKVEHNKNKT